MAFFADLRRFPEAVILPSRPVGGVWLRDYQLCFSAKSGNMYVANNSSILQYCHGMSIEGVLVFYRTIQSTPLRWRGGGGGGLTARKSSLIVTPPPLFFQAVGRKKGGRNSGAAHTHAHAQRLPPPHTHCDTHTHMLVHKYARTHAHTHFNSN